MSNKIDPGVVYTPASVASVTSQQRTVLSESVLDSLGVRWIRLTWCDWTNTIRYQVLSRSYLRKLLNLERPGFAIVRVAFGIVLLHIVEGFSLAGEYLMVLDPNSFRLCPYAPGHATIFAYFQEVVPHPEYGLDVLHDPRTLVARVERLAKEKAGVSYLVGFESEFCLLKSTTPPLVFANNVMDYAVANKLRTGSIESTVVQEIAEALEDSGIEIQKYHAEAAPGQFEMITGPLSPVEAADALVHTRETIFSVAAKHGLRATFAPRLHVYGPGTAAHVHLSVHDLGTHPDPSGPREDEKLAPTLKPKERSFLQGVLDHIPSIAALTLPTKFSYGRVMDGIWSGGTYVSWGTENRECPVRLCGRPGNYHMEVRCVDGTSNPHLALAGILGAGTRGIIDRALLKSGDCQKSVAEMTDEERAKMGLTNATRIGPTLPDSRKHFQNDSVMRELFSDDFVDQYCKVNETLEKNFVAEGEDATTEMLVNTY